MNGHFFKEDIRMANKCKQRWSTSLVIREMQIKITMRYYFTLTRMARIKNLDNKCWWECGEIRTLIHWWWEYKIVLLFWEILCWFLKRLNIKLSYDPAIPLLGIYSREMKICTHKNWYTNAYSNIINNSQKMENIQMPINQWINKT